MFTSQLQSLWHDLLPRLVSTLPAALTIIVGALILRILAARLLYLFANSGSLTREMVAPFVRLLQTIIAVVALILILSVFGFDLGGLWTLLATVLGMIAIGFVAVWSLLSNASATLIILVTKPYQVGDDVEFAGEPVRGRVIDLNFFYTTLLDDEGRLIQIPNNLFFQKTLKRRRNEPPCSLAYQLNSGTPAALPPPPPAPVAPASATSAALPPPAQPNPLLNTPDPGKLTPRG